MSPFQICPSCRELVDVVDGRVATCACGSKLVHNPDSKRALLKSDSGGVKAPFEAKQSTFDPSSPAPSTASSDNVGSISTKTTTNIPVPVINADSFFGAIDPRLKPGARVVITGKIPGMTRAEAFREMMIAGYLPTTGVGRSTDVLIVGEGVADTLKMKRASQLGLAVIPWGQVPCLTQNRTAA